MPTMIDEHPAFFDTSGRPLVDGSVFIGVVNSDPEANPTPIFSDRALSVALANPQTINTLGRATNKIWIPGEYSMKVEDSNSLQVYQELDNGEDTATGGATTITNILGTNTITGNGTVTPIISYGEDELFIFQSFGANTGAVTLNFDGVGARALVYDFNLPLEQNHIEADQSMLVSYNSGEDNFQWMNPNRKVVYGNESISIATSSTVQLHDLVGNSADITGTTTVTSFGTTPDGSVFWLTASGAFQITYNAVSLIIPAQANYTTTVGDVIRVQSLGSGNNSVQIFKVDGKALVETAAPTIGVLQYVHTSDGAQANTTNTIPFDDTFPTSSEGFEVMTLAVTPTTIGSILRIDVHIAVAASTSATSLIIVALFKDSGTDAVSAAASQLPAANNSTSICLNFSENSVSLSSLTYRVRLGATAGTTTFNGASSSRRFEGVSLSTITVTEYSA